MTEVLTDGDMVARKSHRCIWCGEMIPKGQIHHVQSGIFDGELYRHHMHQECYAGGMVALWNADRFALEDGFEPHAYRRGTMEQI